jgi:hypothetical protein
MMMMYQNEAIVKPYYSQIIASLGLACGTHRIYGMCAMTYASDYAESN